MKYRWNDQDKKDFSTNRLRATSIPKKKFDGPDPEEWDEEQDTDKPV
jgi:hypothetical protein